MKRSWNTLSQLSNGVYAVQDFERAAYRLVVEQVLYASDRGTRLAYHLVEDHFDDFIAALAPLGHSGCGKTTILNILAGLDEATDGVVIMDGVEVKGPSLDRGVVFQRYSVFPHLSVLRNTLFGIECAQAPFTARLFGYARRTAIAEATEMLNAVGLGDSLHLYPAQMSGGMQQRVGLARAFVTDAPILLMDEPFSALDPLIRTKLQDELLDLQRKLKRTIVFVSHDLDEAFKIGNRIALMEGGRIVQCGTAREIIANPVSEYVADFVAHMNPLGVLTARDVMEPGTASAASHELPAETPVKDIMDLMSQGVAELVVTENGRNLGMVRTASLMAKLINPRG